MQGPGALLNTLPAILGLFVGRGSRVRKYSKMKLNATLLHLIIWAVRWSIYTILQDKHGIGIIRFANAGDKCRSFTNAKNLLLFQPNFLLAG